MKNVLIRRVGFFFLQSSLYCAEPSVGLVQEEYPHQVFLAAVQLSSQGKEILSDSAECSMEPMSIDGSLFRKDQNGKLIPVINGNLKKNFVLEKIENSKLHERRRANKKIKKSNEVYV